MIPRTARELATRGVALGIAVTMATMLFVGAEEAGQQTAFPGPYLDKVAHAAYFGVFTVAVDRGLAVRSVVPALAAALALGAADELHQRQVPGRESDILDWGADALGAIVAVLLWRRSRARPKNEGQTLNTGRKN